jgi:hypothetical protein
MDLGDRGIFQRGYLGRLDKLTLLLVPLTIPRSSKINSCDNNLKLLSS